MSTKPKTKSSITRTARTILEKDAFTFHQSTLNGMIQQIISNKRYPYEYEVIREIGKRILPELCRDWGKRFEETLNEGKKSDCICIDSILSKFILYQSESIKEDITSIFSKNYKNSKESKNSGNFMDYLEIDNQEENNQEENNQEEPLYKDILTNIKNYDVPSQKLIKDIASVLKNITNLADMQKYIKQYEKYIEQFEKHCSPRSSFELTPCEIEIGYICDQIYKQYDDYFTEWASTVYYKRQRKKDSRLTGKKKSQQDNKINNADKNTPQITYDVDDEFKDRHEVSIIINAYSSLPLWEREEIIYNGRLQGQENITPQLYIDINSNRAYIESGDGNLYSLTDFYQSLPNDKAKTISNKVDSDQPQWIDIRSYDNTKNTCESDKAVTVVNINRPKKTSNPDHYYKITVSKNLFNAFSEDYCFRPKVQWMQTGCFTGKTTSKTICFRLKEGQDEQEIINYFISLIIRKGLTDATLEIVEEDSKTEKTRPVYTLTSEQCKNLFSALTAEQPHPDS